MRIKDSVGVLGLVFVLLIGPAGFGQAAPVGSWEGVFGPGESGLFYLSENGTMSGTIGYMEGGKQIVCTLGGIYKRYNKNKMIIEGTGTALVTPSGGQTISKSCVFSGKAFHNSQNETISGSVVISIHDIRPRTGAMVLTQIYPDIDVDRNTLYYSNFFEILPLQIWNGTYNTLLSYDLEITQGAEVFSIVSDTSGVSTGPADLQTHYVLVDRSTLTADELVTGQLKVQSQDGIEVEYVELAAKVPNFAQPAISDVVIHTNYGDITVEFYPAQASVTVENFFNYVTSGFYNDLIFHRVIEGFMIQGGGFYEDLNYKTPLFDPIVNEADNGLSNVRGSIAMARTSNPDSATSQFFINLADNPGLDPCDYYDTAGYCVFGQVTDGMEVVDAIGSVETKTVEHELFGAIHDVPDPCSPIVIESMEILPEEFNLTVEVIGEGTVFPSGGIYTEGTVVPLSVTPASGYRVKSWQNSKDDVSTDKTNVVMIYKDTTVTVELEAIPSENLIADRVSVRAGRSRDAVQDALIISGHGLSLTSEQFQQTDALLLTLTNSASEIIRTWDLEPELERLRSGRYVEKFSLADAMIAISMDLTRDTFMLNILKTDLTGLDCPMTLTIDAYNYQGICQMDEDVVNGSQIPIPMGLLTSYRNALAIDTFLLKQGNNPDTDVLVVKGALSMQDPDVLAAMAEPLEMQMGDFSYSLANDGWAQKGSKYIYRNRPAVKTDMQVLFLLDTQKCWFQLVMKNADIDEPAEDAVFRLSTGGFAAESTLADF